MKPVLHALRSVANAVAPTLGAAFIRLWGLTLRPRVAGRWHWRENRGVPASAVLAFWHDQLLIMCVSLIGRRFPYGVLVSRHPDAEAMARAVTKLGLHVIRGSSTSGGVRALAEMAAEIRSGRIMIVTPDGPKGPRHRAGDGALVLARRAGLLHDIEGQTTKIHDALQVATEPPAPPVDNSKLIIELRDLMKESASGERQPSEINVHQNS